jgi:hypothetical protein
LIALDADAAGLDALIARLDALDGEKIAAPAMRRTLDRMRAIARSVAHVKTGRLRGSMTAIGPVAVGAGTLEGRISPVGTFYAIYEVARGGPHDYTTLTIEGAQDEFAALAATLEADVARYVRGG